MKTIYLLRHAKSSWDDDSLSDFVRPLNERGLRTAPFMGEVMKRRAHKISGIWLEEEVLFVGPRPSFLPHEELS